MASRMLLAIAMLGASSSAAAGQFCAVTSMGAQCTFPTLESCQQALQGVGGQCVVNPAVLPQPAVIANPHLPSLPPAQPYGARPASNSIYERFEQGRRAAREDEERKARIELLKAQTQAVQQRPPSSPFDWAAAAEQARAMNRRPVFSCNGVTTDVAAVGCVVVGFAPAP